MAEKKEALITRHGNPAGILIGFESEDDWFDYRLENDPRFSDVRTQAVIDQMTTMILELKPRKAQKEAKGRPKRSVAADR